MASFNTVNGVPVTANRRLITDVLKTRLGFDGFVMSDFAAIMELKNHGVAADLADAARRALHAGIDFDMESKAYDRHLEEAVVAGKVPISEVDAAVRRVLRVKYRMGLFEDSPGGPAQGPAPRSHEETVRKRRARWRARASCCSRTAGPRSRSPRLRAQWR